MELINLQPDAWKTEESQNKRPDEGKTNCIGDYPDGRSESERGGVVVRFTGDPAPCVTGDDCNYITTHEIQLSELSEDEQGSSEVEEEEEEVEEVEEEVVVDPGVSSLTESDPRDAANFTSSDERASKSPQQCGGSGAGQIHLSIRTSINDDSGHAGRSGARLRRKGAPPPDHSSGTSSAVSEPDDADKEVRSLTARAFKSLAYPYFNTRRLRASTEGSSASTERAVEVNRWSIVSHHRSSTFEIAKNAENKGTKKLEPMGEPAGGLIRLTETLNFCCNVKSGLSAGGERRANFAQNAAGSRSPDGVTAAGDSQTQRGAAAAGKSMEETHKKAILASSLIKNVISKKMQFEQERRMERGEIREPPSGGGLTRQGSGGRRELLLRRQSSSSECAPACADEPEDVADDAASDAARRRAAAPPPVTDTADLDPPSDAGIVTKKGAPGASNSTLLLSRNSAFRCWRDDEVEFQRERKSARAAEAHAAASDGKATKMSRLFVPSVGVGGGGGDADADDEAAAGQQQQLPSDDGGGIKLRSDNTLYMADSRRAATSKSPEIQINLRSARADDFKCLTAALKGESAADRTPHFTVRDVRDNKGKLQTPIHQVRDVRKLVKSSYHFVSLDTSENKPSVEVQSEQKRQHPGKPSHSVSPIVIKCQSVNTNSNEKQPGSVGLPKRCCNAGKMSPEVTEGPSRSAAFVGASEESCVSGSDGQNVSKRPEKFPDVADKKPGNPAANRLALEKLQAAVKTMEQLYVYEKNEWKRKDEPRPLTDSHVLSMIATERPEGPRGAGGDKAARCDACSSPTGKEKDGRRSKPARAPESKTTLDLSPSLKSYTSGTKTQLDSVQQGPFNVPKSPKVPASTKIGRDRNEGSEPRDSDRSAKEFSSADHENYLTIPVKANPAGGRRAPSAEKTSVCSFGARSPPGQTRAQADPYQAPKPSGLTADAPSPEMTSASIYHSLPRAATAAQPQFYCFPPTIPAAPPSVDPFQSVQRKVLLDPSTGSYYLVDTPVQPATKRLFDPETGHYVDVPMPQAPMAPLPLSIPHLALSPGPAYMIYPGFVPTPSVIPARTLVQSQLSMQSEVGGGGGGEPGASRYMESPLYMTTGNSPHAACGAQPLGLPGVSVHPQQGPRIIAPPSFDGTTMSFVVEHR